MNIGEKTIKVRKDKKHKVVYPYGKDSNHIWHRYVVGPATKNLWYRIVEDNYDHVIAVVPVL